MVRQRSKAPRKAPTSPRRSKKKQEEKEPQAKLSEQFVNDSDDEEADAEFFRREAERRAKNAAAFGTLAGDAGAGAVDEQRVPDGAASVTGEESLESEEDADTTPSSPRAAGISQQDFDDDEEQENDEPLVAGTVLATEGKSVEGSGVTLEPKHQLSRRLLILDDDDDDV